MRLLWGEVRNIKEVMDSAHYRERGFWIELDHPKTGRYTSSRLPFIMSETATITGRAPLLGEHNEEVYQKRLGYSKGDSTSLREDGII